MSEQQHEAGRALDALVAVSVMGWKHLDDDSEANAEGFFFEDETEEAKYEDEVPYYSFDIADAMLVVERLWENGLWCQMRNPFTSDDEFWCGFTPLGTGWNGRPDHRASAPTLPLAICRAALLAVGESDE